MQHNEGPRLEVVMIRLLAVILNRMRVITKRSASGPAEYDFPVFPVVSEARLKSLLTSRNV